MPSAADRIGPLFRAGMKAMDGAIGWGRERPGTERWRHERRWMRGSVTVALRRGFTVGGTGTLRWVDHGGNRFPFTDAGNPRRDLTRKDRTGNARAHDYEPISGELRVVRLF